MCTCDCQTNLYARFTVTLTRNDVPITRPVLIYQDELSTESVVCRSSSEAQVGWHFANGVLVPAPKDPEMTNQHFQQRRTSSETRLINNRPGEALTSPKGNGLWSCRLSGSLSPASPVLAVGIYASGGGKKYFIYARDPQKMHEHIHIQIQIYI